MLECAARAERWSSWGLSGVLESGIGEPRRPTLRKVVFGLSTPRRTAHKDPKCRFSRWGFYLEALSHRLSNGRGHRTVLTITKIIAMET
jgi:hypothetical protein